MRPAALLLRARVVLVALALVSTGTLTASSPARAADRVDAAVLADDVAGSWFGLQRADGAFSDPFGISSRAGGYGVPMIGYAMLRAGVRSGDRAEVAAGLRSALVPAQVDARTPFDLLGSGTAYAYAARALAGDPLFEAVRVPW